MKNGIVSMVCAVLVSLVMLGVISCSAPDTDTAGGWVKYKGSPVLGGDFGTIFDVSVLKEKDGYRMWNSWRPKESIALSVSKDGFEWSDPEVVLAPNPANHWEERLNRPAILAHNNLYHMWYTGQSRDSSWIGYATSVDGRTWKRMSNKPVLSPDKPWEKVAVMCPHVIWDEQEEVFKMWYSGGEQYEPDAIGFATSKDGMQWEKYTGNPVFKNDPANEWEQYKVTACQVIKDGGEYIMFYIGFRDIDYAQIGLAKSRDGIGNWQRHPQNPIIKPGTGWDASAVYKPFAIYDGKQWLLWYNGRNGSFEQIGVAVHKGKELF